MTQIDEIKTAIAKLSDEQRALLKDWLDELEAQRFDEQIERDAAAGKLDSKIAAAKANWAAGRRRDL